MAGPGRGDEPSSRPGELEPGTMVGEYQIEGILGAGGMGKVFSAIHPVIAKKAAVKVLHPELSVNRETVERFVQEARSVNQIGHPNIVDIFSFGNLPDGRCYFVMEWLKGESLRDRLRRSGIPLQEALAILETVCVALEAAHEKGIVHRDLKPDNVFLVEVKGAAPTVKLLDFGIAKLLGNDGSRVEKTRTGNLMGTPAYISPEQARGQFVDHRTDIYALGAMAYELFTGWLPFPADSAADMIAKHLYQNPPPASLKNPQVPPRLDQLVMTMMAKEADERPTLEQVRTVFTAHRGAGFNETFHAYGQILGMPTPPSTPAQGSHVPAPAQGSHVPAASAQGSYAGYQPPTHTPDPRGPFVTPGTHTPMPAASMSGVGMTGPMYQGSMTGGPSPEVATSLPPPKSSIKLLIGGLVLGVVVSVGAFIAFNASRSDDAASAAPPSPATAPGGSATTEQPATPEPEVTSSPPAAGATPQAADAGSGSAATASAAATDAQMPDTDAAPASTPPPAVKKAKTKRPATTRRPPTTGTQPAPSDDDDAPM